MGARGGIVARIEIAEANGPPAAFLTRSEVEKVLLLRPGQFDRLVELGILPCALKRRDGDLWAWRAVKNNLIERLVPAGIVYVVGFGPYVKIGFTRDRVEWRVAELQVGCPETIQIIATINGGFSDEARLHRRFADIRLRGEWFKREGAVAAWIDEGCPL